MSRVLAVLVVALLVAGVGCAESDDSYDSIAQQALARLRATPTPAPGSWGTLAYDQKHDICQEAAETVQQTADEVGRGMMLEYAREHLEAGSYDPGALAEFVAERSLWPRAQSMFYDDCMRCGGPTEVIAHADEDSALFVECRTQYGSAKPIPEGHRRIWP